MIPQSLLDFGVIPTWGKPKKGWTHFLHTTLEAEFQEVTKSLGAAQSLPGWTGGVPPRHVPAPGDAASCPTFSGQQPQPSGGHGGSPLSFPSSPPHFLALLCVSKAGTPLSRAPDHPAGEKKDNWAICLFKKED